MADTSSSVKSYKLKLFLSALQFLLRQIHYSLFNLDLVAAILVYCQLLLYIYENFSIYMLSISGANAATANMYLLDSVYPYLHCRIYLSIVWNVGLMDQNILHVTISFSNGRTNLSLLLQKSKILHAIRVRIFTASIHHNCHSHYRPINLQFLLTMTLKKLWVLWFEI